MTSTTVGLPDRYRLLDEVGPEEQTPSGVIRSWRAKDRVLNRDVAVRVHTPAGSAAHAWITRALTAGGLANPALAMVYDASEGSDDGQSAAYVVNEWIEGETLAERLGRGPLTDRDVRPMMRRLADGVAEAHRVGLAVGGLTADNVVLRPNGLVGLRGVPAATGSIEGDIAALGALLEACLTGTGPGTAEAQLTGAPDLVALVRRARSTEPGQSLSSVAAMAALLAERPRPATAGGPRSEDEGRRRRQRDRRTDQSAGRRTPDQATPAAAPAATSILPAASPERDADADAPRPLDPQSRPPVPGTRPVPVADSGGPQTPPDQASSGRRGDTVAVSLPPPAETPWTPAATGRPPAADRGSFAGPPADALSDGDDYGLGAADLDDRGLDDTGETPTTGRRRLVVVGLLALALALVVALAWWFGSSVLSVAGNVDEIEGSTPSSSAPADDAEPSGEAPATGEPVEITGATVFDPGGDGAPENDDRVPQSFDGDPATAWPTLTYQGSPAFGNLKDGVGVVFDLGSEQELAAATLSSTLPGSSVEIRAAAGPEGALEDFPLLAEGTLEDTTEFAFDEPVATRYVLVWFTELVPDGEGFTADLAEVTFSAAG